MKVEDDSGCAWGVKVVRALDGCDGDETEDVCYWTGSYLTVTQNESCGSGWVNEGCYDG